MKHFLINELHDDLNLCFPTGLKWINRYGFFNIENLKCMVELSSFKISLTISENKFEWYYHELLKIKEPPKPKQFKNFELVTFKNFELVTFKNFELVTGIGRYTMTGIEKEDDWTRILKSLRENVETCLLFFIKRESGMDLDMGMIDFPVKETSNRLIEKYFKKSNLSDSDSSSSSSSDSGSSSGSDSSSSSGSDSDSSSDSDSDSDSNSGSCSGSDSFSGSDSDSVSFSGPDFESRKLGNFESKIVKNPKEYKYIMDKSLLLAQFTFEKFEKIKILKKIFEFLLLNIPFIKSESSYNSVTRIEFVSVILKKAEEFLNNDSIKEDSLVISKEENELIVEFQNTCKIVKEKFYKLFISLVK